MNVTLVSLATPDKALSRRGHKAEHDQQSPDCKLRCSLDHVVRLPPLDLSPFRSLIFSGDSLSTLPLHMQSNLTPKSTDVAFTSTDMANRERGLRITTVFLASFCSLYMCDATYSSLSRSHVHDFALRT
jgi:hypothetical protein